MAIVIRTSPVLRPEELEGKSHWWGAPDLPEDVPYPCVTVSDEDGEYEEPLTFLCQIRLEEIAGLLDEETAASADKGRAEMLRSVPREGMLYFFAPLDYFLGEADSPLDYHEPPVLIYIKDPENLHPYVLNWEDTGETVFRPSERMEFCRTKDLETTELPEGDIALFPEIIHEEMEDSHTKEHCLLKIEENDRWGLRFYDCGTYYIFLKGSADFAAEGPAPCASELAVEGDLFFY